MQWARDLGATVIATVSGDDKARIAERLGAHHIVIYTRENFVDAVMRITSGQGADVIYDAVGADTFADSLEALAARGHLVSFGQASGPVGNWDIGRFASKSVTVSRPNYAHFTDTREKLTPHVERFFGMLRQRRHRFGAADTLSAGARRRRASRSRGAAYHGFAGAGTVMDQLGPAQIAAILVLVQRGAEELLSQRNTRRLLAEGAREEGREYYPVVAVTHLAWIAALYLLVPVNAAISVPLLVAYL